MHHNMVHAGQGGDVRMTMVAGRTVDDDRRLAHGQLPDYLQHAETAFADLLTRRQAWLIHHQQGAESPL